ncbi:Required for respiratory growth protein 9 mitochondrial [Pleosporales sp. CAS-2024a]
MACPNCIRTTLRLFTRSFTITERSFISQRTRPKYAQPCRFRSTTRRPPKPAPAKTGSGPTNADVEEEEEEEEDMTMEKHVQDEFPPSRPAWAVQKAAVKAKLDGAAWNPRKKLSPDAMDGIRHLHTTQPTRFTTPILAEHFKVSPEAIRRILKSKWRPSDDEYEARMARWNKRGERIWTNLVEMGVKPPKKWRDMGVGRAVGGARPKWKGERRNLVGVRDSVASEVWRGNVQVEQEDTFHIPIVDGRGKSNRERDVSLRQRL